MSQKPYRLRNWGDYNKGLCQRGSLTLWLNEEVLSHWQGKRTGKRGAPFKYSDSWIESALTIREIFRLPLRQTQGLLLSLCQLLALEVTVPDYTTLCRRQRHLSVNLSRWNRHKENPLVDL